MKSDELRAFCVFKGTGKDTSPLNWETFYPVPRRFKTSRRFAVRFSSIPITFISIAVNFVFLNCIFTTMNHLKTGKNREEVKCEESLIYRVVVLRNSASDVDRLPQIWQIPANYPLWSFISQNTTDYNFIPKYPSLPRSRSLGTFSIDDEDVNENVRKQ